MIPEMRDVRMEWAATPEEDGSIKALDRAPAAKASIRHTICVGRIPARLDKEGSPGLMFRDNPSRPTTL